MSDSDGGVKPVPGWAAKLDLNQWGASFRYMVVRMCARMREVGAVRFDGPFALASGAVSDHYFDVKRLLLDPAGLHDAAHLIVERLCRDHPEVRAVGGPELGVIPLVGGVLTAWWARPHPERRAQPLTGFMVRKEPKGHGTGKLIEGDLPPGTRVALVEDVTTTAGSVLRATDAVEAVGGRVEVVFVVVNRGGDAARRAVQSRGAAFVPLLDSEAVLEFTRPALLPAPGEEGVTT